MAELLKKQLHPWEVGQWARIAVIEDKGGQIAVLLPIILYRTHKISTQFPQNFSGKKGKFYWERFIAKRAHERAELL